MARIENLGVSKNRGPQHSTLNTRILIIRTPKIRHPGFSETPISELRVSTALGSASEQDPASGLTLTYQNLQKSRVPINSVLGFIIRTYKKVGFGRLR